MSDDNLHKFSIYVIMSGNNLHPNFYCCYVESLECLSTNTVMMLSFRTDRSGQTVQRSSLIRVYTVCYSLCIFWTRYSMVEPHYTNFRVITTKFLGVRIFRKFTVGWWVGRLMHCLKPLLDETSAPDWTPIRSEPNVYMCGQVYSELKVNSKPTTPPKPLEVNPQ